ncbi:MULTISPECIES: hypothetical protein [Pelosinus]|jgi:hypothetical protein|uniref:Uncharacterized protein n=1 Tax=Pelosinus fermentans B4 TaxID=1149862 RepID=I9AZN4_9FIRM|nr:MULTISPECIES: hypothetical protein [Pelosinus]EIW18327.1 hypothetical protein FB4_3501 [Pelosinus fermentans B4]EIW24313.1 hypothetical protein FA11_3502 [Pelosinus fermentans A11]OAM94241.1 hypothetical protein FR7_02259 [Pelosinus fermentans DSM 17108]SDR03942.1 hypothetical protein SAMN04515679_2358 [Pelosinus fermentans]
MLLGAEIVLVEYIAREVETKSRRGRKGREGFDIKQFILALLLVAMQYTVNPGDTLYCQGDDPRQVAEYREGIRELNYDVIGESDV